MKKKIIYIVTIILSICVGAGGMIAVYHYLPPVENTNKTTKQVSITEENTIKSAVDKVYNAVVLVETYKNDKLVGTGTGFVYKKDDKNGYIITNHHVIEGGTAYKLKYISGIEVDAKLLGSDAYSDIAVLSTSKDSVMEVAEIGDSSKAQIGDTIFTVGSPLGEDYMGTVTKGILSGKDRTVTVSSDAGGYIMQVLQTDAAMNPGNSGGPLVNVNGEVIGVNSIKLVESEIEGMGFSIPIEIVMTSVNKLEKGEKVTRPLIGIEMSEIDNTYLLYKSGIIIDKSVTSGVVVVGVQKDTPASAASLEKGDVVAEIDGTKIDSVARLRYTLYKYSVGDKIKVKYYRGKDLKEVTVTLNKAS
ncbi:MAG: trypsin-like peptidase domain-containing protein [Bacilli bacterium]|nr:trypsin-like peptidase domain-containing protein [Bacilli bacterium]